ncbi:hypothetical protein PSPO01_14145 [Paraphaeosphaeria sporulosa]
MPPTPTLTCTYLASLLYADELTFFDACFGSASKSHPRREPCESSLSSQGLHGSSRAWASAANFVDCVCHAARPLSPRQAIG